MSEQSTLLDNIQHPWPDPEKPTLQTRLLLDALPLAEMRGAIASSPEPETMVEIASTICNVVHQSLKWESLHYPVAYGADTTYTERIRESQITNCFGFAIITSELLDRVGIKHNLAYMGGHATNLVRAEKEAGRDLYLVNADYQKINQFIGNTLIGASVSDIEHDLGQQERVVRKVDTARLIINSGNYPDDFTHAGRHQWLRYQKSEALRMAIMEDDPRYYQRRYQKIMTIYSPEVGRQALLAYGAFFQNHNGNLDIAVKAARELYGIFPEVDVREKHTEIKSLIRNLAQEGRTIDAIDTIGYYCSSLAVSKDPRAKALESKLWRILAKHSAGDSQEDTELAATGVAYQAITEAREREHVGRPSQAFSGHSATFLRRIRELSMH